jgi:hypothetical protein
MLSDKEQQSLQATLDRLGEYRKYDPEFKRAMAAGAEAEAVLGDDPLEREIGEFVDGHFQPLSSSRKQETELQA